MGPVRHFSLPAALLLAAIISFPLSAPAQTPAQTRQSPGVDAFNPASADLSPGTQPRPAAAAAPRLHSPPRQITPELLGDVAAARKHYRAAIAAYSKAPHMTAKLWDKTGVAYEMLSNFKDALRCYRKAIKQDPSYSKAYNNLGTLYGLMQEFRKAERVYRTAVQLNPKSARFLRNLGTDLLAEHKFVEGWKAYKQALAIDPEIFGHVNGPKVGNAAPLHERGAMYYYIALGCTRAGDARCAVANLRGAIDRGFVTPDKVAEDEGFNSLHDNHWFQQLLAEEKAE